MWRYLVGAAAGLLLVVAGMMLQASRPQSAATLAAMPAAAATSPVGQASDDLGVPEALPKTRGQKRFNRYDKDRDGSITRDEYLLSRHKAYAKLDKDGNGILSFDEWSVKAQAKFAGADKDKSGAMNASEFAATAVKRKSKPKAKCPPGGQPAPDEATGDDT